MNKWQVEFLRTAEKKGVLMFGEFTLKSGRQSPYFFDVGNFNDGDGFMSLCSAYAKLIHSLHLSYDVLFGAAYKGIPLVAGVSLMLNMEYGINIPFCFNRKEEKEHGEGGMFVGAKKLIEGGANVLLLDDVMTAGTSMKECINLLAKYNCRPVGIVIAIDRQETSFQSSSSSDSKEAVIDTFVRTYSIPVHSVIQFTTIHLYLDQKLKQLIHEQENSPTKRISIEIVQQIQSYEDILSKMNAYRNSYGAV